MMLWLCLHFPQLKEENAHLLEDAAEWALQFTARISLAPPQAVLLEIGGSLHYFGGLEALRQQIDSALAQQMWHVQSGIAPTPTAALLLARANDSTPVIHHAELGTRLGHLSVNTLALSNKQAMALQGLGCRSIDGLRSMPADGLARRLGRPLLRQLQCAFGERADPCEYWAPSPTFSAKEDLTDESWQTHIPLAMLSTMIDQLCQRLQRLHAEVSTLAIELQHRQRPPTTLNVGVLTPTRDAPRLKELLAQHLDNLTLKAPIIAVACTAGPFTVSQDAPQDLLAALDPAETQRASWQTLVEDLSSRLSKDRVRGLQLCDEHRPEYAWQYSAPAQQSDTSLPPMPRPLWLLEQPRPLAAPQGQPQYHGQLVLEQGPERIESGWWDGHDIRRDYYLASNTHGERLWIFRDRRKAGRWYLHGLFA